MSQITLVTNAGKFASNAPTTGAWSLGAMFAVPQTVFGCLTNPDKGSGMSLVTDAGKLNGHHNSHTYIVLRQHKSQGCIARNTKVKGIRFLLQS